MGSVASSSHSDQHPLTTHSSQERYPKPKMKPFTASVFGLLLASGSGLTQARPQQSESGLVANIISQLTPFVQSTVEEALRSRSGSATTSVATTSVGSGQTGGFGAVASTRGSAGSAGAGVDNDGRYIFNENPQYTYAYQVASDEKQTYIQQTENRDGANVNGEYSYVDANGSLVTVKYTTNDVDGYSETRDVQEGFVQMRYSAGAVAPKPVAQRPAPRPVQPAPRPAGNNDLVAKIIAQLTPYIKTTVTDSLSARSQPAPVVAVSRPVAIAAPVAAVPAVSVSGSGSTQSIFGVDGENSINVETPEYTWQANLQ